MVYINHSLLEKFKVVFIYLYAGRVPAYKKLNPGTVPAFKKLDSCTLHLVFITRSVIFNLELGWLAGKPFLLKFNCLYLNY